MDYPVVIYCPEIDVPVHMIEIVSVNLQYLLRAFSLPVDDIIYHRISSSTSLHLFYAIDNKGLTIYTSASQLANITGRLNMKHISKFSFISSDPLCSMIPQSVRMNMYPPIFGFDEGVMEFGHVYDIEKLKQDGYFALIFTPVPGVDFRGELIRELAEMWGIEFIRPVEPDILIFRVRKKGFFGVPEDYWLKKNLQRLLEDKLPLVTVEGTWMAAVSNNDDNKEGPEVIRSKIFLSCLEFFKLNNLPYITSQTFYCHVNNDLSVSCALGSAHDMIQLQEYLEQKHFLNFSVTKLPSGTSDVDVANMVYGGKQHTIAIIDGGKWYVVHSGKSGSERVDIGKKLREYYKISCQDGFEDALNNLTDEELLKVVRISDCARSKKNVVCITPNNNITNGSEERNVRFFISHRAYLHAIRSDKLKNRKTIGVYKLGPYGSPFFSSYPVRVLPPSRYGLGLSRVLIRKESEDPEEFLLEKIVGKVWLFSIYDKVSSLEVPNRYDVIQISSDRDMENIKDVCYHAWSCGFLMGNWCKVMLKYKDKISISVNGGSIDPYIAQASDSIVDGNRWLDQIRQTMTECTSPNENCLRMKYEKTILK